MHICSFVTAGLNLTKKIIENLNFFSETIPALLLRVLLAWEFGEAGFEKLHGTNWFVDIAFPFPFNLLPPDISWGMATFFEITGAFALATSFIELGS